MDFKYPEEFLKFNKKLFESQKSPYPENGWGANDYVWRLEHDNDDQGLLIKNYYFPPLRAKEDLIIAANHGIIPSFRVTQMDPINGNLFAQAKPASQWRYDELNRIFRAGFGKWTQESVFQALLDQKNRTNGDQVGGSISVINTRTKIITSLSGHYGDKLVSVTYDQYFSGALTIQRKNRDASQTKQQIQIKQADKKYDLKEGKEIKEKLSQVDNSIDKLLKESKKVVKTEDSRIYSESFARRKYDDDHKNDKKEKKKVDHKEEKEDDDHKDDDKDDKEDDHKDDKEDEKKDDHDDEEEEKDDKDDEKDKKDDKKDKEDEKERRS